MANCVLWGGALGGLGLARPAAAVAGRKTRLRTDRPTAALSGSATSAAGCCLSGAEQFQRGAALPLRWIEYSAWSMATTSCLTRRPTCRRIAWSTLAASHPGRAVKPLRAPDDAMRMGRHREEVSWELVRERHVLRPPGWLISRRLGSGSPYSGANSCRLAFLGGLCDVFPVSRWRARLSRWDVPRRGSPEPGRRYPDRDRRRTLRPPWPVTCRTAATGGLHLAGHPRRR